MARIVKAYAVRRDEILDAAQRLVYTRGYEKMSIQDILDELQIAKGTFYYYFDSKQSLLEALIERLWESVEVRLVPVVRDPQKSALDKLQRFFSTINQWKNEQKSLLLAMLQVWYADENTLFREKMWLMGLKWVMPLLTTIINQGIQEGVMSTPYPDRIGALVLVLGRELGDTLGRVILSAQAEPDQSQSVMSTIAVYTDAFERLLGIPAGSLTLVDIDTLKAWFSPVGSTILINQKDEME